MRCGCFLLLLAIALIGFGIEGIHEASSFHAPVSISYDAFSRSTPKEGWYRVTGCRLELPEAIFAVKTVNGVAEKDTDGEVKVTKVYLPVHNDRGPDPAQVRLVVQTEDAAVVSTIKEMRRINHAPDKQIEQWIQQNEARLVLHRDLQGMISESTSLDTDVQDKVKTIPGLGPSYAVLEDGDKPSSMGAALGSLVLGGVLFVVTCIVFLSSFIKPNSGQG